ncbi:MAG TPA: 16S rRNA (adenine(1518)-N(6)/adenine(1519)-N(6))-dimethyltransferase RsmA [Steroidobacteraceae bacterium]|nr:16S rRNA (adenine(1518)-N(6)/adenine(1519)-N(6))-dimethyltransferase RsmA [Steroidobacteraceae bacterium]
MAAPVIPPRKRFGQHFLHDPAVISRIIDAVGLRPGDAAVEIGPGRGALTGALLQGAAELDAIEIDRDLAASLRERFAGHPGFRLHVADALGIDWQVLGRQRGKPLRIIGNLPYNIATALLFRLLASIEVLRDMHFMLQREVADRILAAPGTQAYGRLGVMLAPHFTAERVLDVGAGAFQPPPRVTSSVVRLTVRDAPPPPPLYGRIVSAAFAQRRKTLRNALREHLSAEQIAAVGLDPGVRAERLTPADFAALARAARPPADAALAPEPDAVIH